MNLRQKVYEFIFKQPYGTEKVVSIGDIIISKEFLNHHPRQWKIDRALDYYHKHGYVDEPITVMRIGSSNDNNTYLLVDGYTRYLAIKRYNENCGFPIRIVGVQYDS